MVGLSIEPASDAHFAWDQKTETPLFVVFSGNPFLDAQWA